MLVGLGMVVSDIVMVRLRRPVVSCEWLVVSWCGVGWEVDGVEGFDAAEADGGVFFFLAYVGDVAPATVAFWVLGMLGCEIREIIRIIMGD